MKRCIFIVESPFISDFWENSLCPCLTSWLNVGFVACSHLPVWLKGGCSSSPGRGRDKAREEHGLAWWLPRFPHSFNTHGFIWSWHRSVRWVGRGMMLRWRWCHSCPVPAQAPLCPRVSTGVLEWAVSCTREPASLGNSHQPAPVITYWVNKWMYESGPRSLTALQQLKVESHFYRHSHF